MKVPLVCFYFTDQVAAVLQIILRFIRNIPIKFETVFTAIKCKMRIKLADNLLSYIP